MLPTALSHPGTPAAFSATPAAPKSAAKQTGSPEGGESAHTPARRGRKPAAVAVTTPIVPAVQPEVRDSRNFVLLVC
jgi:hypothetical protein